MGIERPLFLLAGNGSYANLGCEAIVRGTVKILRNYYEEPRFACLSHFSSEEQYKSQCLRETDKEIFHLDSVRLTKGELIRKFWKLKNWKSIYRYFFKRDSFYAQAYENMLPYLEDSTAILSVGGDNYSLDYGVPKLFTALDDVVLKYRRPIILWGASIGPFNSKPEYEKFMSYHLRTVSGIFARESVTIDYLKKIGVSNNVFSVTDPAFVMDPMVPKDICENMPIEDDAIGFNLSPLMARYVTGGNVESWSEIAASIIREIAQRTNRPIYLIPHVITHGLNDYRFMQDVLSRIENKNRNIFLIPPKYNAAETKWIISRMAIFVGARTHATIASLSSNVPTLSLAYSIKSIGINQDIFGHTKYCQRASDINSISTTDLILKMLDQAPSIRKELFANIPRVHESAMNSGIQLKHLLACDSLDHVR